MTIETILPYLQCPVTAQPLVHEGETLKSIDGTHSYPMVNGIPRFVGGAAGEDYTEHWKTHAETAAAREKEIQGKQFVEWLLADESFNASQDLILDIGCGDGNHLAHLPERAIKIAVDYSGVVDLVAERHGDIPNLFVLQADALNLPIRSEAVRFALSYGCLNVTGKPKKGLVEVQRVLSSDGIAGIWGYGTDNPAVYYGLHFVRTLYHATDSRMLKSLLTGALIPSLSLFRNSTQIRPFKNSLAECREIISTNLSPQDLHILYKQTWDSLAPDGLEVVKDYDISCGQKFQRSGALV